MNNKRNLLIMIIAFSLILILGSSYAYLMYTKESSNNYVINVGTLEVTFVDSETQFLNLTNMYPMTDEEGEELTQELVFQVKNTGNVEARYNVYLEEVSTNPEFKNYIRFITNKNDNGYNEPKTMGYDKYIDLEARLKSQESASYKVKVWLDQDADNTYMNKEFKAKVVIEGNQIDNSKTLYTKINNAIKEHPGTTIVEDDITYLSGSNTDVNYNYVWYSGKLWRITSINSDGTIKMITNNPITSINFSSSDYKNSYAREWLNEDFLDTLYNYKNIIQEKANWNITINDDYTAKIPKTTIIQDTVGLLDSYEYYQSYKNFGVFENAFLNTKTKSWVTLTLTKDNLVYRIDHKGEIFQTGSSNTECIKPVIVLQPNVLTELGNGSLENPYVLKGDKNTLELGKAKLNSRTSGEYVKYDNQIYRIVEILDENHHHVTKLVKDDVLPVSKAFTSGSEYYGESANIEGDYWDYYLNNTWYNEVSLEYRNMMVPSTYYLGFRTYEANSYKLTICESTDLSTVKTCQKTSKTWIGYVGLLRVSEMFSVSSNHFYQEWLISPGDKSKATILQAGGTLDPYDTLNLARVRPTITLSDDVIITSGKGTYQEPFEISCPSCNNT